MTNKELHEALNVIRGQLDLIRSESGERPSDTEIRGLAEQFCELDDDGQSKFFVEVARVMTGWPMPPSHGMEQQAWHIGRHLATCECSTEDARNFIRTVHDSMERGPR